jgi:hypothetical protein
LAKVRSHLFPEVSSWLFGSSTATALDAHLLPFLVRLRECGRAELISEDLGRYADASLKTPEWKSVMGELKLTMKK